MKYLLLFGGMLTAMPVFSHAQSIRFVDTVTVTGYFYVYSTNGVDTFRKYTGPFAHDFLFVAEKDLQGTPLNKYLLYAFFNEADTVKYLSAQVPEWLHPYRHADSLTLAWKDRVTDVYPFLIGQRSEWFGHNRHKVFIVKARIRWLRLRMPGKVACDAGFNRPISLDCWSIEKRDCNVYLPLETLELQRGIKPNKVR